MNDDQRRLDFGHFVDRIFWFLLTGAALYTASQMRDMGRAVEELNKNMSIVIYQVTEGRPRADKVDSRLDKLEERARR